MEEYPSPDEVKRILMGEEEEEDTTTLPITNVIPRAPVGTILNGRCNATRSHTEKPVLRLLEDKERGIHELPPDGFEEVLRTRSGRCLFCGHPAGCRCDCACNEED